MVESGKEIVFPETGQWLSTSRLDRRVFIQELESRMLQSPDKIDVLTENHFSNGIYLRKGFIPKDTLLVGEIHKFDHLNVMLSGSLRIITEFGMSTVNANDVFESVAGTKKVGYAIEDTHFITVHRDDSIDATDIRARHTVKEYGIEHKE